MGKATDKPMDTRLKLKTDIGIISKQTVNWFCLVIVLYWLAPLDGVVA